MHFLGKYDRILRMRNPFARKGACPLTDFEKRLLVEYFGNDQEKMRQAEQRLAAHEPIAYIVGETVFYDETYKVNPAVLIPRPDTERVVEKVLKYLPRGGRLLDLCCGSGCIAISSLCHSAETTAVLLDISREALDIAKENANLNRVLERCSFICADLFKRPELDGQFDVIVSNPPYVATEVIETLEEECHKEPYIAFDGGRDGGDFYRLLLAYSPRYLKENGKLIFEIGYDQREMMEILAEQHGFGLEIYKDYGGNDRVAVFTPSKESV